MLRENHRAPLVDNQGNPTTTGITDDEQTQQSGIASPQDDQREACTSSSSSSPDSHNEYYDNEEGQPYPTSPTSPSSNNTSELRKLVITAATTAATLGYDVGIMAAAIQPIQDEMHLSSVEKEVAMGSLNFVAALGAVCGGAVANRNGRKPTIVLACLLLVLGTIFMACAFNYPMLLIGRIVTGLGVGVAVIVTPVYLTEVAPTEQRGRVNTIFDLAINVGILLGYVVGFVVQVLFIPPAYKWRVMLGLGMLLPVLILRYMAVLPESPRWLVMAHRPTEARDVLQHLGQSPQESHKTIHAIQQELDREANLDAADAQGADEQQQSYYSSWSLQLCCRFGPLLAMGMGFWQQITGTEAVLYYSGDFLAAAGLDSAVKRLLGNVCVGMAKLGPELVAMSVVDKIGRRPLMIASSVALTLALALLSLVFYANDSTDSAATASASTHSPILVIVLLCAIMAAFSIGVGPFSYLVASENLGLTERANGMTMCAAVNRCTSGMVALSTVSLYQALGDSGFFALYATISALSVVFYYWAVPETSGLSLEELAARARGEGEQRRQQGGGSEYTSIIGNADNAHHDDAEEEEEQEDDDDDNVRAILGNTSADKKAERGAVLGGFDASNSPPNVGELQLT